MERLQTAMMLLFGVAIFSYIMGNFIDILGSFQQLHESFEQGDTLAKFFGLLHRFNRGKLIDHKLKTDIENFFDYKWSNDKNLAIIDENDKAIMD